MTNISTANEGGGRELMRDEEAEALWPYGPMALKPVFIDALVYSLLPFRRPSRNEFVL